jgi:hypothetical protein
LRDGTFLLTGDYRPIAIRFRGDLTSPYIKRSGNIVLIEPEKSWKMYLESRKEAENILRRLRKNNPNFPWMDQEITD